MKSHYQKGINLNLTALGFGGHCPPTQKKRIILSMQYKSFTFLLYDNDDEITELNIFLNSNKIINIEKNLVQQENKYYWNFLIEYIKSNNNSSNSLRKNKKVKIDYKEVLSSEDFEIFSKLREIRKETADKEGIPVYGVFNNEQLSEIVTKRITTKSDLKKINGVGKQKINLSGPILDYMKGLNLSDSNEGSISDESSK